MLDKIDLKDMAIHKLNQSHISTLQNFTSYEKELIDFLVEDALRDQMQKLSVTFLWFFHGILVSYITLLNDRINLEGSLKDFFKNKGVYYKSLPALKIGRLCVHNDFLRRGLGTFMIEFAIHHANYISQYKAGCRFITLDAKRNEDKALDSILFYRKLGFTTLKERTKGLTPMFLDLVNNSKFSLNSFPD